MFNKKIIAKIIPENTMSTSPTLWVGTNSGLVLVLSLSIPHLLESRQRDGVTAGNQQGELEGGRNCFWH